MKENVSKKKKPIVKPLENKFLEQQKYAEQEFHLVDPLKDETELTDESGLAASDSDESLEKMNNKEE